MNPEATTSDSVMNSTDQGQLQRCPRCRKPTKRIKIELEGHDWGRIWVLGFWAAFFPGRDQAFVCEHCGNVFERREIQNPTTNRVIGILLLAFSIAVVIAVVILLGWGMINNR